MNHPGPELKLLIKQAGFKQHLVGMWLGVQESQFSEILNGKRPLSAALCLEMERHLGLDAKEWNRKQADYDLAQVRNQSEAPSRCAQPPAGWWCSRTPGHEGPCCARKSPATLPIEKTTPKS